MAERRSHLILVGLILAALVGTALLAIPGSPMHRSPTLGLDLQGGLEVILKAKPEREQRLRRDDLDRALEIMRSRVDKIGVAEPELRTQGDDQIAVELPGVKNAADAQRLIGKTAKLEFYDLEADLYPGISIDQQGFPIAQPTLHALLARAQSQAEEGTPRSFYLFDGKNKLVAGPAPTRQALLNTKKAQELIAGESSGGGSSAEDQLPKGYKVFAVPEKTVVITCRPTPESPCPGIRQEPPAASTYFYLFRYDPENGIPEMTGEHLRGSGTRQDFDPTTSEPIVSMQFTEEGQEIFHEITRREAQRGRVRTSLNPGGGDIFQHFAIVLDHEIQSTPYIDFNQNPDGIGGGGGAQITGMGSVQEAKDLALVLQTGALPVNFVTLSQTEISATLGEDSLKQAVRAAIAGLLIVALFLLVFYRFLGLVAVIGLGIYAAFLYAAILVFNVTLTLPGFAGMILTIGVAADANIVIFERIKEEARAGKSVRAAIATGYGKGFSTIIDANVVTAITAMVLFAVATAGVKGFALMLLIGTAMSLVTAVAATRAMLGLLAGFRWFNSPRFMGAQGQQTARWIQRDFVGKRNVWFAFSTLVLLLAIGSLALQGLNLGIDFRGGSEVTFRTTQPVALEDVRSAAGRVGFGDSVIQGVGRGESGRYSEFQLRSRGLDAAEQRRLREAVAEEAPVAAFGATTVSASFGRQIAESAIYAILFSLLLVLIYISIRFEWKFSIGVIVALLHDILIAVGIYSLLDREVTTATVAAILTVLGYSIYDTIIILDRVRENMPIMRRASFATIANVSLWETIRRSLATTFITLLPVGALFLFGGDTLKDFAFALLVGIGFGAYSSIFIAAPLVAVFKEREPEYARRRDADGDGRVTDGAAKDAVLVGATRAAAATPAPELAAIEPVESTTDDAKRERRRQRRRARPHGRAR